MIPQPGIKTSLETHSNLLTEETSHALHGGRLAFCSFFMLTKTCYGGFAMSRTLFRTSLNVCAASPVQRCPVPRCPVPAFRHQTSRGFSVLLVILRNGAVCMGSSSGHNIAGAFFLANNLGRIYNFYCSGEKNSNLENSEKKFFKEPQS